MESMIKYGLIILISLSSLAEAAGLHIGSNTTIKKMRMSNTAQVVVYTEGQAEKANCATTKNGFILKLGDNSLGDRYYSTMLTAFATNKVINMWCPGSCQSAYGQSFTVCNEVSIE